MSQPTYTSAVTHAWMDVSPMQSDNLASMASLLVYYRHKTATTDYICLDNLADYIYYYVVYLADDDLASQKHDPRYSQRLPRNSRNLQKQFGFNEMMEIHEPEV
ncbi:hypothetical protein D9758_015340 [Tetrapyrgos nigripes]|uniref:Uncharacterized protein n=1 Tax=Tetrapyrgos nigripes TaxID=182062 RepID=A0A8H5CL67_9AGAR|nr:hypothetical protein D9758_015340 [Tetrapyrgos nigripes]